MHRAVLVVLLVAGCPRGNKEKTIEPSQKKDAAAGSANSGDSATAELPPPAPLPEVPKGLPPLPATTATPELVAAGEALFKEPRLATTGKLACATCHDPAKGFAGTRQPTAAGPLNLRRTPALVDLAWKKAFGWDGRYPTLEAQLAAHVPGQLGDLAAALAVLAADPQASAQLARAGGATPETALKALAAYIVTRYEGDAPWDRAERSGEPPAELKAGYQLFTGKAQCAVCHPPPLYTDLGYHRLGLIASHDEGRGRVDPAQQGAFATPTLRGAARRPAFFHDASATTLDAAIDWHLAGGTGQGADPSIVDPALKKLALSEAERAQLGAFVRALSEAK